MAKKDSEKVEGEGAVAEPAADSPLLDLSDAAVKRMIKAAKRRGFVTHDELNAVLPSEEVTSDQIEDIYAMLSEMGISVVESEEAEEGAEKAEDKEEEEEERRGRRPRRGAARHRGRDPHLRAGRPHRRPRAHVPARDGLGGAAVARGRDRHRQADRGRPRGDDRRALREPADLPGHHHLARRAQRRQGAAARDHRPRGHLCGPRRQEHAQDRHDGARRPGGAGGPQPPRAPATAPRNPPPGSAATCRSPTTPSRRRTTWRIPCRCPPWRPS